MMRMSMSIGAHQYEITTDHSASSYGQPVVLRDGELTNLTAEYSADECHCSALGLLADIAGIHNGPATRTALDTLAAELYPHGIRSGAACDAVIAEFRKRGAAMRAAEDAE
jgi:hypothetical protein